MTAPTGATGPTGPAGVAGAAGLRGEKGEPGEKGDRGPAGAKGADGIAADLIYGGVYTTDPQAIMFGPDDTMDLNMPGEATPASDITADIADFTLKTLESGVYRVDYSVSQSVTTTSATDTDITTYLMVNGVHEPGTDTTVTNPAGSSDLSLNSALSILVALPEGAVLSLQDAMDSADMPTLLTVYNAVMNAVKIDDLKNNSSRIGATGLTAPRRQQRR